jgi:hypothetical protein
MIVNDDGDGDDDADNNDDDVDDALSLTSSSTTTSASRTKRKGAKKRKQQGEEIREVGKGAGMYDAFEFVRGFAAIVRTAVNAQRTARAAAAHVHTLVPKHKDSDHPLRLV